MIENIRSKKKYQIDDELVDYNIFEINKLELNITLARLINIIPKKSPIPLLNDFKIQSSVADQTLTITATDLEISVSEKIYTTIHNNIELCIPALSLFNIIKKLPKDTISKIYLRNKLLYIDNKNNNISSIFSLPYNNAENYPILEKNDVSQVINIKGEKLISIIEKTKLSMSQDSTRYNLQGISIILKDSIISACTTDMNRLSFAKTNIDISYKKQNFKIILPKKTVFEIPRIVEKDEIITLSVNKGYEESFTKIQLKSEKKEIISKLNAGIFPNYESVIPELYNMKIILDTNKFLDSLNRVSVIFNDNNKGASIEVNDGKMLLNANSSMSISAKETLLLEHAYNKEQNHKIKFSININYLYIIDALNCLSDSDNIEILFIEEKKPIVIKKYTDEKKSTNDDEEIYVIMPMII